MFSRLEIVKMFRPDNEFSKLQPSARLIGALQEKTEDHVVLAVVAVLKCSTAEYQEMSNFREVNGLNTPTSRRVTVSAPNNPINTCKIPKTPQNRAAGISGLVGHHLILSSSCGPLRSTTLQS